MTTRTILAIALGVSLFTTGTLSHGDNDEGNGGIRPCKIQLVASQDAPDPFSPNGDTSADTTTLSAIFAVRRTDGLKKLETHPDSKKVFAVRWTWTITSPVTGAPVRTLTLSQAILPPFTLLQLSCAPPHHDEDDGEDEDDRGPSPDRHTHMKTFVQVNSAQVWDGKDSSGQIVAAGTYPYTLTAQFLRAKVKNNGQVETKKIIAVITPATGTVTVEAGQADTTPPTLTAIVIPPANANGWHRAPVTVSFSATDTESGVATVTPPQLMSTDGATQPVTGIATDHAGNSATLTVFVSLDQVSPLITAFTPANGAPLNTLTPVIQASYGDALSGVDVAAIRLSLDGQDVTAQATITSTGLSFTSTTPLAEGLHTVHLSIEDIADNPAIQTHTFTVDVTPPSIALADPTPGSLIGTTTPQTRFTYQDAVSGVEAVTFTVFINGQNHTSSFTASATEATGTPILQEGLNTLQATIQDRATNLGSSTATIEIDSLAPNLIVETPETFATFTTSTVLVRVRADDPHLADVRVNGQLATPTSTGAFETTLTLTDGAHALTIEARDTLGHVRIQTLTIFVDTSVVTGTALIGRVLDTTDQPIPGITVSIPVQNRSTVTGADGRFTLTNLSAGFVKLLVDGATAQVPGTRFPTLGHSLTIVDNVITTLPQPIFLPGEDLANAVTIPVDQIVVVTTPMIPTFRMTIQAGDVTFPNGTHTGEITVTEFPGTRTPFQLPDGHGPARVIFIGPSGMSLTQGAGFVLPNHDNAPLGTRYDLFFAGHAVMAELGPGSVRQVGSTGILSDLAARIVLPGCFWALHQGPSAQKGKGKIHQNSNPGAACGPEGSHLSALDGALQVDYALAPVRTQGTTRALQLVYTSTQAHPVIIQGVESEVPPHTVVPSQLTQQLSTFVEGLGVIKSTKQFLSTQGWNGSAIRQAATLDLSQVQTGILRLEQVLSSGITNEFDERSERGTRVTELIPHVNTSTSPLGAGWGVAGVKRLQLDVAQRALLQDGSGAVQLWAPVPPSGAPILTTQGRAYLLANDRIKVVDAETMNLQTEIILPGSQLTRMALSANGARLFVADWANSPNERVVVIDTATQQTLTTLPVFTDSYVPNADGSILYASNLRPQGQLWVAVVDTGEVLSLLGVPLGQVLPLPDGRVLHVSPDPGNSNQSVLRRILITPTSQEVETLMTLPRRLDPVDGQHAGTVVRVTHLVGGQPTVEDFAYLATVPFAITIVNLSTSMIVQDFGFNGGAIRSMVPSPDASQVLVASSVDGIFVFETPTGSLSTVFQIGTPPQPKGLRFTADGAFLLVSASPPNFGFSTVLMKLDALTHQEVSRITVDHGLGFVADPTGQGISSDLVLEWLPPQGETAGLTRDLKQTADPADDEFLLTAKDGTTAIFDATGLHTKSVDRNGNATRNTYDGQQRLTQVTFQEANQPVVEGWTLTYNAQTGKLSQITDRATRTWLVTVDGAGHLTQIRDPLNQTREYSYAGNHLLTSATNERSQTTNYGYDAFGKVRSSTGPDTTTQSMVPQEVLGLAGAGEGTPEAPLARVPVSQVAATVTDEGGDMSTLELNGFGQALKTTDPLLRQTVLERDSMGNPTRIQLPNNTVLEQTFDMKGNLLTSKNVALNATTTFQYEDTFNQVTRITDPLAHMTVLSYDSHGNPTVITDALGNQTHMGYNAQGLLLFVVDALNQTTQVKYDALGRLTLHHDPLDHETVFEFDLTGRMTASINAKGQRMEATYDAVDNLTSVRNALGHTTSFAYDAGRNLTSITDPQGNIYQMIYDNLNRLTRLTGPLGTNRSFQYDPTGNPNFLTNDDGAQILFAFDAAGRVLQKTLPLGDVVQFDYDLTDNLTSVRKRVGGDFSPPESELLYTYDVDDRLQTVTTGGSLVPAVTLSYDYDLNGNVTAARSSSHTEALGYDALNRPVSLTTAAGTFTFSYDAASRRTSLHYPNGVVALYDYDRSDRLITLTHARGITTIASAAYTYDSLDNVTTLTDPSGTHAFRYDGLSRLTEALHPLTQPFNPAETYQYDGLDNRAFSHLSNTYTYNAGNRLLEDDPFRYEYDLNGNQTTKIRKADNATETRVYDAENQLTKITFFDSSFVEYKYDGLGHRIAKLFQGQAADPRSRVYIYDNEDLLEERSGNGQTVLATFTYDPLSNSPLTMRRNGADFFYHTNLLGTVTHITDAQGQVVKTYTYDTFGQLVEETGTVDNPLTFTGHYLDRESATYFLKARTYDPRIGRFLQAEDVQFLGGKTNFYTYVDNNPATFFDPDGFSKVAGTTRSRLAEVLNRYPGKTMGELKAIAAELVGNAATRKEGEALRAAIKVTGTQFRKTTGKKVIKKVAKCVPLLGFIVTAADAAENIQKKGVVGGVANVAVDAIPVIGTAKVITELLRGKDLIPDKVPDEVKPADKRRP